MIPCPSTLFSLSCVIWWIAMLQTASTAETFICIHWFHPASLSRKCPCRTFHYRIFFSPPLSLSPSVEITKKTEQLWSEKYPRSENWNIYSMWLTITWITVLENLLSRFPSSFLLKEKKNSIHSKQQLDLNVSQLSAAQSIFCLLIVSKTKNRPLYHKDRHRARIEPTFGAVFWQKFRNRDALIIMILMFPFAKRRRQWRFPTAAVVLHCLMVIPHKTETM